MRTRELVVCASLLAACTDGAIDIVVPTLPNAAHVALYFSVGGEQRMPIQPARFDGPVPSNWWPRDPQSELDVRDVAGSDEVVFELARGAGGETKLSIAILVAYNANGIVVGGAKLTDLDIPADYIARHVVQLAPIDANALTYAQSWGPEGSPAPQHTCAMFFDRPTARVDMVVSADDPDCDGFVEGDRRECAPNIYMAEQTPLGQTSCLSSQPVSTCGATIDACVLGGPTCVDGIGPMGGCNPTNYCLPKSVCDQCTTHGDFGCAANLVGTILDAASYPTHLTCRVGIKQDGSLCGDDMLAWADLWPDLAGRTCQGEARITHGAGWSNQVDVPTSAGAITIEVKNLQGNCNFTIKASGNLTPLPGNAVAAAALVAGDLDNGRGISIPIVLTADTAIACGTVPTCDFVQSPIIGDYMFDCVNATP